MASRVGDYLLFETLGKGAFGKVKLGVHEETGEQVAVKIMDKSDIKAKEMTMNVRREIAIMKALKHKNIVNLRQVLTSKTKLYIVMDLVTGGELFTKILSEGKLEEGVARKCFQQLVDGIEYCHRRGVCHRDLKPENLLIDETTGELKITDFGLSAMKGASTAEELLHTQCGSPNYCAPEIIAKHKEGYNGAKVDAWSCGIILFTLLAGYLPFYDDKTEVLYKQIQFGTVKFPRKFPEGARDLVLRLLHKNPDKRYTLMDCKRHPWFLVNYEGDDAPGKQNNQANAPARRKRRPKRPSVDQDPMKMSKADGTDAESRSRSGNSIPDQVDTRADANVNGDAAKPAQTDLPPLPPIIASPGNEAIPPPRAYAPAPVPPPIPPTSVQGTATYAAHEAEPAVSASGAENFAVQHTHPGGHNGLPSSTGLHGNERPVAVSVEYDPRSSDLYHPRDAPPPYEKVASTGSFATRYPPLPSFSTPSHNSLPPLFPSTYVPPAYGPPEYTASSYTEYAPPPPPPDYGPPADGLSSEVGQAEYSRRESTASGGLAGNLPFPPNIPRTPPPLSDITSVGRDEHRAEVVSDQHKTFDLSSENPPWIANRQAGDSQPKFAGKQRFDIAAESAASSVAEKGASTDKESNDNPKVESRETSSGNESMSLFEKRRAMFGASITSQNTPANSGANSTPAPAPLPDVTTGPAETLSEGLRSEESLIKMSSSFKALPSLARNFEVLPINFSSPDQRPLPPTTTKNPALQQEDMSGVLRPSPAETGSTTNPANVSAPVNSAESTSATDTGSVRGEGIDSSVIDVKVGNTDMSSVRSQSESSDSKTQRNLFSSDSHDVSSNTVIIHDEEDAQSECLSRADSHNRLRTEVQRYRNLFALSDVSTTGVVPLKGDSEKGFFAEAARISMSWGVVLKRNVIEVANISQADKEEVEAFSRLLDFWEQYRIQDVQGKEFSSPLGKEELRLAQNLIEKLALENVENVGPTSVMVSDANVTTNLAVPVEQHGALSAEVKGDADELRKTSHKDAHFDQANSKLQPPYEAPHRLEITPSTVRDPFRPSLAAGTQAYGSRAPRANLPPIQSTLAANEAAAVMPYGAHIPANVRVAPGKAAQRPNGNPRVPQGRRSVSNASSHSSDRSDSSRENSGARKRSSATAQQGDLDSKDLTVPGKSYFGFRRHANKRSWPMFEFESKLKPDRCLMELGRILTDMGGRVMMKRGENKMKYEGQGKMLVSIVCTLNNGLSKVVFKKGKKDKSRTDGKQFLRFFQTVHARFMKVMEGTAPVSKMG